MGYGYASQLGIDSSDPVTKRFNFDQCSLMCDEEFLDTNGLRGTREHDVTRNAASIRRIHGPITFQPNKVEWQLLLPWILGTPASGTTYALAETVPARYVTVDRVDKVFTYDGCKVDRATITGRRGQALTLTLDLVGIDETIGNSGSFPSLSIDTATGPFMFHHLGLTIGGAGYACQDFTLVIDNMLDKERFLNSQTIVSVNAMDRQISFSTNVPYSVATAAYNTGASGAAVVGTFTNGSDVLTFSMVKVCFPRKSPMNQGKQEVFLPLQGLAYKSSSTLSLVTTLTA